MLNIALSVAGTSRMVVPVSSSTPNSTPMNSRGVAIHALRPSDSGPPMAKPTNPAACWRPVGSVRRPRPEVPQSQSGQGDHRRAEDQAGRDSGLGSVRINVTAITASAIGQQYHRGSDQRAQRAVDPRADRSRGVEPRTGGDHHRDAHQRQRDPVAAVAGLDVVGAADRSCGAAHSPGDHQPGGPRSPADPRARGGDHGRVVPPVGRSGRLLRGAEACAADREPAFDLLVLAPERAAVLLGMGASLIAITPSAPSATLVPPGHMRAFVAELLPRERGAGPSGS